MQPNRKIVNFHSSKMKKRTWIWFPPYLSGAAGMWAFYNNELKASLWWKKFNVVRCSRDTMESYGQTVSVHELLRLIDSCKLLRPSRNTNQNFKGISIQQCGSNVQGNTSWPFWLLQQKFTTDIHTCRTGCISRNILFLEKMHGQSIYVIKKAEKQNQASKMLNMFGCKTTEDNDDVYIKL